VERLNYDPACTASSVQLPLPNRLTSGRIIEATSPLKDVTAFTPTNLGLLAAGYPRYLPCTPHGVQQILLRTRFQSRARMSLGGRSNIVGKPLALTSCKRRRGPTPPSPSVIVAVAILRRSSRQGDIVVVGDRSARF